MSLDGIVSALPGLLSIMPLVLQASQAMFFVFFVWFFGSMTMRGYRGKKPLFVYTLGILVMGALCLVAATAFAGFMPFLSGGLLALLQLDVILSGLLVSAILAFALTLMTHTNASWSLDEKVKLLKRKIANLEDMLKRRSHHITENDAMHIAEHVMDDYKARHAKLVGNEYEVVLKKDHKEGRAVIDAWDGEVLSRIFHESSLARFFTDPKKVLGLLIIIFVGIFAAVFFEGFPDPAKEITSLLGIDAGQLGGMASSLGQNPLISGDAPEGCVSPLIFMEYADELQDQQYILDHLYDDEDVAADIGSRCGKPRMMIRIFHEGQEVVMGFTADGKMGYTTDGIFCACIDTEMAG